MSRSFEVGVVEEVVVEEGLGRSVGVGGVAGAAPARSAGISGLPCA
jgi:hypothetical protein